MLIGREHEQQGIERLASGARLGSSGVLAITGEPGVGKTALLRWAEGQFTGFRVLRATGTEQERDVPFAGLLAVLRPVLDQLEGLPAPQARALAAALALDEGSAGDRFAVGAAALSLLCRCAEEAPVAVLLDDAHLLDGPSAGALFFAARRLGADPVAMLVAAREGEADDLVEGLDRLVLPGLDHAAARSLVNSLVSAPVTEDWVSRVHEITGGNPLAITELALDPDALAHTGPDLPPPLSVALATSFSRRVGLLDPETRSMLLVAVVCNGDLRLIREVGASLDLAPELLATAQDAGLVDASGGEVTLRHPLLRAAIYYGSTPAQRRTAHAAVAAALPRGRRRPPRLAPVRVALDAGRGRRGPAGARRGARCRPLRLRRGVHRLRALRTAQPRLRRPGGTARPGRRDGMVGRDEPARPRASRRAGTGPPHRGPDVQGAAASRHDRHPVWVVARGGSTARARRCR